MSPPVGSSEFGTGSPLPSGDAVAPRGERSARQRRVRGPFVTDIAGEGPLTRPKRVDLSPKGEVKKERSND
jgi:hypothetical protein